MHDCAPSICAKDCFGIVKVVVLIFEIITGPRIRIASSRKSAATAPYSMRMPVTTVLDERSSSFASSVADSVVETSAFQRCQPS